jgi:hypothetical protein
VKHVYRIRVWDNFHYQDDEEAYDLPETFEHETLAIARAKAIVEESCGAHGYDFALYCMFGEDPLVLSPEGKPRVAFSGRSYAEALCQTHQGKSL